MGISGCSAATLTWLTATGHVHEQYHMLKVEEGQEGSKHCPVADFHVPLLILPMHMYRVLLCTRVSSFSLCPADHVTGAA